MIGQAYRKAQSGNSELYPASRRCSGRYPWTAKSFRPAWLALDQMPEACS
jgi:hypothetical protein